jgi:uncharacterized protein (UPF0264 family)
MNLVAAIHRTDLTGLTRTGGPGLLVSVRDAVEAAAALAGGASVIDVKEPNEGPLGAASLDVIAGVVEAVAGAAHLTVATGELGDHFPVERLERGVTIAKLGLAGCADQPWRSQAEQWVARLPVLMWGALVGYADWEAADAPTPEEVLAHAIEIGCRGFVVDTWSKGGGCTLDLLARDRLKSLIEKAIAEGLAVVLAGSITAERIDEAASCGPTLLGVRGAACVGGRAGVVDPERVRALARRLDACRRGG